MASNTWNNLSGWRSNSPPCKSNSKYPSSSASSASFLIAPMSKYSLTWSPFGELVKQYLHRKLQALLKFRSIPLVLVPTFPSFFWTRFEALKHAVFLTSTSNAFYYHTENLHHYLGGSGYDEVCWSLVSTR